MNKLNEKLTYALAVTILNIIRFFGITFFHYISDFCIFVIAYIYFTCIITCILCLKYLLIIFLYT